MLAPFGVRKPCLRLRSAQAMLAPSECASHACAFGVRKQAIHTIRRKRLQGCRTPDHASANKHLRYAPSGNRTG